MDERETFLTVVPPWKVLPDFSPSSLPATQGLEEAYFDQEWRPFWSNLTEAQRAAWLDHWQADEDWRRAITFYFEPASEFDAEADLREAEEWRKREQAAAQKPSFWSWLFGR